MAFFFFSLYPGLTWVLIGKKSLLICFESYQGMVFPITQQSQSKQSMMNTFLMVNINPRYSLKDKSMLFTYSYLM